MEAGLAAKLSHGLIDRILLRCQQTLVAADTYAVASAVHDLLVKTHSSDDEKIATIKRLVAEHLDVDRILAVATPAPV